VVTNYILKKPPIDPNRIQKIAKRIIEESGEDRELAQQAYTYFKEMVDENPQDTAAKSQMVDCLKLMQSSKTNILKILDNLIKQQAKQAPKTAVRNNTDSDNFSIYKQISELSDNDK